MIHSAPDSAYRKLAGLALVVDGYRTERHELDVSSGFRRVTTEIVLVGGGLEGRGEDVTYAAEDHDDYPAALPLAGEWTLDGFSQQLGGLDLFPDRPPQEEFFRNYRRWGFESAALDLALRQQKLSLGEALGQPYSPLRFVLSTRLDIKPWLAVDPALEFKLDPTPEWDERLMQEIAATGRVRALDFKSFYTGSPVDNPPDPVQYRLVSKTFPGAVLEDPALDGPAREVLRGEEGRFSFDAPVHSWEDVEALTARVTAVCGPECDGFALRQLNIKPSRFGSLSALLYCVGQRPGRRHGPLRRRPVRARHRPRPDPGAGQPSLRGRPERRGSARVPRRRACGRSRQPARAAREPGRGLRLRVRGLRPRHTADAPPAARGVARGGGAPDRG